MKEFVKLIAFIFLIIGTIGILTNEFIIRLGWMATVSFANLNVLGLLLLAVARWLIKSDVE
ncbi:hypothetical protein ACFLYM_02095 [Chloroflexota bacterium]